LAWRDRPDGSIEIEGRGAPSYAPGHPRHSIVVRTWHNFGCSFTRSSARHGVPIAWLLAIASVESGPWSDDAGAQQTAVSPAGALGVMQIMPQTAKSFGRRPEDMLSAPENIDVGAELLARLIAAYGPELPAICAPYNSGKLCCSDSRCGADCENPFGLCTDSDYPGAAIRYNNTAVKYINLASGCTPEVMRAASWGLIAAGAAGAAIYWSRRR